MPAGMARPDRPCHAGGCLRSAATQTILYTCVLEVFSGMPGHKPCCTDICLWRGGVGTFVYCICPPAWPDRSCHEAEFLCSAAVGAMPRHKPDCLYSGVGTPAQLHLPAGMARPATGRAVTAGTCVAQRWGLRRDINQFVQIFVYAGGLWHDREKSGMPRAAPCAWHAGAGSKIQSSTNPEGSILSLGFINPFLGPLGLQLCHGQGVVCSRRSNGSPRPEAEPYDVVAVKTIGPNGAAQRAPGLHEPSGAQMPVGPPARNPLPRHEARYRAMRHC